MSTTDLRLITCDLCQRRYNINVYQRHRNENQCIKRNQSRLPFESIKQRSIQIGDQIFPVQKHPQKTNEPNLREKRISIENKKVYQERILPSNNRRRALEQAKQLLERRIRYKPPLTEKHLVKLNRMKTTVLQTKELTPKSFSPPTTKFKNDEIPINNHRRYNQPILTHSPKTRPIQVLTKSKNPPNRVDQTFSHEQITSPSRPARKAYTWTRSSKQKTNRDIISPIQIPTFCESSSSPRNDRITLPFNSNYDDDEFERYSPTPPSTPKYEIKTLFPPMIRPSTYQKLKRSNRPQETQIKFPNSPKQVHRKKIQPNFRLPPINPSKPKPWR